MKSTSHPLHLTHLQLQTLIINRLYTLFHSIALTTLIYYRLSSIFALFHTTQPFIPHILIFIAEFVLSFIWLMSQSFLWRPVTRTVFPDRLSNDDQLPPIDVFICTADPQKEPPLGVMNTVVSTMALNYPPEKLCVYLSDDGGCLVTLEAMQEAWKFAKLWVPFCKKYDVKTICPSAYFDGREVDDDEVNMDCDEKAWIKVMVDESMHDQIRHMPLLVYVSREKRPSHPHHFKAGALNALLRVSSVISNSPYILGLDCDMYCNDKNSARQAMCFHLDPNLSSSLAFVQFPQKFHNISKHDIYESELRCTFKTLWQGMDGIKGPCLSGTCYYLKREALYQSPSSLQELKLEELRDSFGSSNEFIKSLHMKSTPKLGCVKDLSDELLQETKLLASCEYENETKWGKEVGFRYFSVVGDFFTSFNMHCVGWVSILYMPSRPSFLGSGTTSLNDVMIQGTRWTAGLIEVAISRFSPVIYGSSRMSILQRFCYVWLAMFPLAFISLWILATIPQLSLLNGVTIYPKVRLRLKTPTHLSLYTCLYYRAYNT
ncbi:cellulose synthase-like protein G2 isoform X2 [Rutidosis leptorrhynchoides]|uniref:cellulose synthase-like protein G2 isoform X2 n=1 Tax=Rutidosis leptorrhynchoides TaxID=125765 RepID=UPI003A99DA88